MGFAASQAHLMRLTSLKGDLELQQSFTDQARVQNADITNSLFKVQPRTSQNLAKILHLLSPLDSNRFDFHWPDLPFQQNDAMDWFFQSKEYSDWRCDRNSLLWIYGSPGSGKTILSASVIGKLKELCDKSGSALAFFYFRPEFRPKSTGSVLLRDLLRQLVSEISEVPPDILVQFKETDRELDYQELLVMLRSVAGSFAEAYIVIDGADECRQREELLATIWKIRDLGVQGLHMLITSRREPNLHDALQIGRSLCLNPLPKAVDLRDCVHERLQNKSELEDLLHPRQKIFGMKYGEVPVTFAQNSLETLPSTNLPILKKQRNPLTLDKFYEGALAAITEDILPNARRLIHFLAFAASPMSLPEVSNMLTVDLTLDSVYQPPKRNLDVLHLLELCGSVLQISRHMVENQDQKRYAVEDSFRSYLSSANLLQGPLKEFFLDDELGHLKIANFCVAYLSQFNKEDFFASRDIDEFPFSRYAAQYWYAHAWASRNIQSSYHEKIFLEDVRSHCNSIRIFDPEWPSALPCLSRPDTAIPSLLYYASLTGLKDFVRILLQEKRDTRECGGLFGNPLQAAAAGAHNSVVQLLLESGADVNAQCGCYGTALCAAASAGNDTVVKTLLYAGADPVLAGADYSMLLYQRQATKWIGKDMMAQSNEAFDIGPTDNALLMATYGAHAGVVKTLIGGGADIDAKDSKHGRTALLWATISNQPQLVEIFLIAGADLNLVANDGSTALQVSLEHNFDEITEALLRRNAEISGAIVEAALQTSMKVNPADYQKDKRLTSRLKGKGAQAAAVEVLLKTSSNGQGNAEVLRKCFSLHGDSIRILRKNLLRERDVLQRLHHPNIVQFLGYRENKRRKSAYLYMEYCNGGDLTQFVSDDDAMVSSFGESFTIDIQDEGAAADSYESDASSDPSLSPEQRRPVSRLLAWSMLEQIAAALAYCHYGLVKDGDDYRLKHLWQQILHRDIKPANVVIHNEPNGFQVKLCDLGLVRIRDDFEKQTLGLGTLAFMPPEVKYDMRPWRAKGDCFSVGATFKSMAMDFEDHEWDTLVADCLKTVPQDRPSSLQILQSAREALVRLRGDQLVSLQFLSRPNNAGKNYVQRVTFELLGRFFRTFKGMNFRDRIQLTSRIKWLQEDTRDIDQYEWTYMDSVFLALIFQDRQRLQLILAQQVENPTLECSWDSWGLSPFHINAGDGDLESLNLLLQHKENQPKAAQWLDLNAKDRDGETAAHIAASHGKSPTLSALLGASKELLNAEDDLGRTPIHRAAANGNIAEIQSLIKAGADVNKRTSSGATAAVIAANGNHNVVAEYLEESNWILQSRIEQLQAADKALEMELERQDVQFRAVENEVESIQDIIRKNIESSFRMMG